MSSGRRIARPMAGTELRDQAPAELAYQRSRDEQTPPRHAAHRWHTAPGRKPAIALHAKSAQTSRGTLLPDATLRVQRNCSHKLVPLQQALNSTWPVACFTCRFAYLKVLLRPHPTSSRFVASGSPTSISTIRLPPYRVVASTEPAGCFANFADHLCFSSTRRRFQRIESRHLRIPARPPPETDLHSRCAADRVRAIRTLRAPHRAPESDLLVEQSPARNRAPVH